MKHIKEYVEYIPLRTKSMVTESTGEAYAQDKIETQRQKTEELSEYLQEFFDNNHIIESSEEKRDEEDTDVWYINKYTFGSCIDVFTKRFTDKETDERRNYLISELQKIVKHIEQRIGQSVGIQKGWNGFRIGLKV